MKYKSKLVFVPLVAIFLITMISSSIAAEKRAGVKPRSSAGKAISKKGVSKGDKVDDILSVISRATSLDSLSRSISKANLSEKDVQRLGKAMKQPTYSRKLKTLAAKEKTAAQKKAKTKARGIEKKKLSELKKDQDRELKKGNKDAHRRMTRIIKIDKPGAGTSMAPASMPSLAFGRTEVVDPAKVESITPQPVTVGRDVYIFGENFGRTRGNVRIRTDLGSGELLVLGWHDDSIVARIRTNIQDIVGESEKTARIFVDTTKNLTFGDVRILPDPSGMAPHITGMPEEFTPGRYIIIEGNNFLSERSGTVEFKIGSNIFEGQVYDWQDTAIDVRLPADVSGLQRRSARVVVRNHAGNETSRSITFEPSKSIGVIFTIHTYCSLDDSHEIGLWSHSALIYTDHDYELLNGWVVKNYYLEDGYMPPNNGDAGSWYREKPTIGASNGRSKVKITVNSIVGWSHTATNYLIVEGPVGLPFR